MVVILAFLGAVALFAVMWCAHHAYREVLRRRRAAPVRCGPDPLPRHPAR
ncbi:hypothetical protein [Saccharothrix coeruleofusca]|nr:hypothetical protein [Saccharothrix coeruleofusca]MBP2336158.1 hypothetical protein [Saccharothrix coeruleofusca]